MLKNACPDQMVCQTLAQQLTLMLDNVGLDQMVHHTLTQLQEVIHQSRFHLMWQSCKNQQSYTPSQ